MQLTREIDYAIRDMVENDLIHVLDRFEKVHVPLRFGSSIEAEGYAHFLKGRTWREYLAIEPINDDVAPPETVTQSDGELNV